MKKLRVLEVSGSFYEMGKQHGQAFTEDIRHFTEDRVQLSMSDTWTGRSLSCETVLALADACVQEHEAYSPELMDELRGISDTTGLSLGELIINNGFTDFIDVVYAEGAAYEAKLPQHAMDDCTAFLVSNERAADKSGLIGQTWDMHDTATPYVILLRGTPDNAPNFLAFTNTGCVGMIGMNEHGISIGINNLQGGDGQIGVTWVFVIRKALMQDNIQDALACITEAKLAGAHNFILMDKHGEGYNIEAMSTNHHVTRLDADTIAHTNHCVYEQTSALERPRPENSGTTTHERLQLAQAFLQDTAITPEKLMAMTRMDTICAQSTPPYHVESSGAAIMRPATGDFWATWGPPANNEYEHFVI